MKKSELRKIIKEELQKVLKESVSATYERELRDYIAKQLQGKEVEGWDFHKENIGIFEFSKDSSVPYTTKSGYQMDSFVWSLSSNIFWAGEEAIKSVLVRQYSYPGEVRTREELVKNYVVSLKPTMNVKTDFQNYLREMKKLLSKLNTTIAK